MKYLYSFKESVIIPDKIEHNSNDFIEYCEKNGLNVILYDDYYDSLPEDMKENAPPKMGMPFFGYTDVDGNPNIVICQSNILMLPHIRNIINGIIEHENIHHKQLKKTNNMVFDIINPGDLKKYFSSKDGVNEVMAFSWNIAKDISNHSSDIKSSFSKLKSHPLWRTINMVCDDSIKNRYKKYIYMYLQKIFNVD